MSKQLYERQFLTESQPRSDSRCSECHNAEYIIGVLTARLRYIEHMADEAKYRPVVSRTDFERIQDWANYAMEEANER
jgi:hypothetical protein